MSMPEVNEHELAIIDMMIEQLENVLHMGRILHDKTQREILKDFVADGYVFLDQLSVSQLLEELQVYMQGEP